jgi:AraC-like DNA-binding protein
VVFALLRELINALDRSASATQGACPREALLMALVSDEIGRADVQALGVPLPHPRNGDRRLRVLCEAVLLAHALPLLAHGASVSTAAAASSYASESAFSAMFKSTMGQSPSHFQGQSGKLKISA